MASLAVCSQCVVNLHIRHQQSADKTTTNKYMYVYELEINEFTIVECILMVTTPILAQPKALTGMKPKSVS